MIGFVFNYDSCLRLRSSDYLYYIIRYINLLDNSNGGHLGKERNHQILGEGLVKKLGGVVGKIKVEKSSLLPHFVGFRLTAM